jgi:Arc/MetJ family transcription regulator
MESDQMRVTVFLDDDLVTSAQAATGLTEMSALLHEALKALVEREAARVLVRLGGSEPDLAIPPRR